MWLNLAYRGRFQIFSLGSDCRRIIVLEESTVRLEGGRWQQRGVAVFGEGLLAGVRRVGRVLVGRGFGHGDGGDRGNVGGGRRYWLLNEGFFRVLATE